MMPSYQLVIIKCTWLLNVYFHTQDERGFDIAGMVNGLLPAVPGLITSIANAAKGGVSDRWSPGVAFSHMNYINRQRDNGMDK